MNKKLQQILNPQKLTGPNGQNLSLFSQKWTLSLPQKYFHHWNFFITDWDLVEGTTSLERKHVYETMECISERKVKNKLFLISSTSTKPHLYLSCQIWISRHFPVRGNCNQIDTTEILNSLNENVIWHSLRRKSFVVNTFDNATLNFGGRFVNKHSKYRFICFAIFCQYKWTFLSEIQSIVSYKCFHARDVVPLTFWNKRMGILSNRVTDSGRPIWKNKGIKCRQTETHKAETPPLDGFGDLRTHAMISFWVSHMAWIATGVLL